MDEKIFYDAGGVKVTNSRFIVSNATYPIANISSVKATAKQASTGCAIILIGFGILMLLTIFNAQSDSIVPAIIVGSACIWGGRAWMRSAKGTYTVVLATSGGEVQAYTSNDQQVITNIVTALNDAIIHRG